MKSFTTPDIDLNVYDNSQQSTVYNVSMYQCCLQKLKRQGKIEVVQEIYQIPSESACDAMCEVALP